MAITEEAARTLSEFRLSRGNVIIGRRGEMGRCAVVGKEQHSWLCGTGSMIIRTGPSIDAEFLQRVLSSRSAIAQLENASVGSTMVNLNQGTLRNLLIPLPPTTAEQETIAKALSDADALIESLEHLLVKKRQIKQGAMQELLTGRTRLPGFEVKPGYKQSEVGLIPEDWAAMSFIQAVGSYIDYRGRTPRKLGLSWGGGDILALSANNVQMGRIDPDREAYRGSEELYSRWMVQGGCEPGDVLLTMEAPLGNVAQIPDSQRYILSQRVLLIKPKKWLHRDFLAHYMRGDFFQKQLSFNSTGSTAKGIQRRKLDDLPIGLPVTKAEQEAIAETLNDVDAEIAALEAKLTKARQLKQGMMQALLTGRIRLV